LSCKLLTIVLADHLSFNCFLFPIGQVDNEVGQISLLKFYLKSSVGSELASVVCCLFDVVGVHGGPYSSFFGLVCLDLEDTLQVG